MANRNMADGTPPGTGPETDPTRGGIPGGERPAYNPLEDPEVIPLLDKPQSELTLREQLFLADKGLRPSQGPSIGRANPWGLPNTERGTPIVNPIEGLEGMPPELADDPVAQQEYMRRVLGNQAMRDMVDPFSGMDDRSLEQMRYQSPVFNDFANILSRHQQEKQRQLGVQQLDRVQSRDALLEGMREIRTRVLRIMVDQFRDDSTQEMPPQVGEMIQAINLLLARHKLVDARLEREKINHLIQGMQLIQYSSAMSKYARSKWYEAPANFYKHHFTTLFKIPGVLEATRALARPDKNGVLGVTYLKPEIEKDEFDDYFSELGRVDAEFRDYGKVNKTNAFDAVTGYRVIQDAWQDKKLNRETRQLEDTFSHFQRFEELFESADGEEGTPVSKDEFASIKDAVRDNGKPASELNENQKKLRALFMKAMTIVHPDIGSDQYDKPIFSEVAARKIFDENRESFEPLLNYEINGKKYRINREAFTEVVNQVQLAIFVGQRTLDTLGISIQYDGFKWRKDKPLPDEIKNYLHFDKAGERKADYGINAEGGVVLLNPVMEFVDPGDDKDPDAKGYKGQKVKINLRLASELAARKGGYNKLNAWEKQQVRTLKRLTRDNTAGVISAWSAAYRELLNKYGLDYIDWENSGRNRGPRDATKHMKNTGDMMSKEEMNPGEFVRLRMLGYYNQISILQAFSAGSAEDYIFGGVVERGDDPFGSDAEAFKKVADVPAQGDFNTWFNRYKYIYARWKGSEDLRKIIEDVVYSSGNFRSGEQIIETMKKLKEKSDFLTKRKQTATETPETRQYLGDVGNKILEFRTQHYKEVNLKQLNARAVEQVLSIMEAQSMINSRQYDAYSREFLGNAIEKEVRVFLDSLDKRAAYYEFFEQMFKGIGASWAAGMKAA